MARVAIVAGVSGSIGNRCSADILMESALASKARIFEYHVNLAADMTAYTVRVLCSSSFLQCDAHCYCLRVVNASWDGCLTGERIYEEQPCLKAIHFGSVFIWVLGPLGSGQGHEYFR